MRGPIDYIIVGFKGNNFTGEILKELKKATKDKTIAVLGMSLISRDKKGKVSAVKMTDPEVVGLTKDMGLEQGLITDDDVEEVGELLEDNSSAGLLIVEQLWAKSLKKAIIDTNGTLIAEGRIHPKAINDLEGAGA